MKLILDTNVLVAALRSRQGASYRLMTEIQQRKIPLAVSVALMLEYEDVLSRPGMVPLDVLSIHRFLDAVCAIARRQSIHFMWRPCLGDPKDELVLELAVAANATHIVTHNTSDLLPAVSFGVDVVTPEQILNTILSLP